ncbi:MAG TPA: hypothetical protein VK973_10520 [Arenicellales bacterium]|nr:hypothetical protein [Arenicellales bacterium]
MANLQIWEQVEKTDPQYTKPFNRGGGFKGTATNATYLAKRATEVFGPMGLGWGVEIVEESYIEGAPIGEDVREIIHKVLVQVWYKLDDQRGEVRQFGQTTFVGKNKHGYFTDEEHAKKSLTDGMSKCLALLGFAADIHLGRYDDNKYVSEVTAEFSRDAKLEEAKKKLSGTIETIKTGIASGDYSKAAEAWFELSDDEKQSIWAAPTKGGPFTTKEREVMKTSEFREAYFGTGQQVANG